MRLIKTLFVDDDVNIHEITQILIDLGKLPFDCKFAFSAEEGLMLLNNSKNDFPEIIFVDINMPLMDGFDFLERYKKELLPEFPNTKLFMLSSSMRSSDKEKANEYTFVNGFIPKPLEPEVWAEIKTKYF